MEEKKNISVTPAILTIMDLAETYARDNRNEILNTTHLFIGVQKFLLSVSTVKCYVFKTEKINTIINVYNSDDEELPVIIKDDRYFLGNVDTGVTSVDNTVTECSLVVEGNRDPFYSEFADAFLQILDRYHIESINYKYKMKAMNLTLSEEDYVKKITDPEVNNLISSLNRRAQELKRQQDVFDFIKLLFEDRTYELFELFSLLGAMGTTDQSEYSFRIPVSFVPENLYKDILETTNDFIEKIYVPENTIEALDNIPALENINKLVRKNPQVLLNNEENIEKIEVQLCSEKYKSIALVGPAGCGKTSIVYDLAQHINEGKCPEFLKDVLIYELSMTSLVAGTHFKGDFEAKCERIFKTVKKFNNVILFIDEGHTLTNAGASGSDGGDMSFGNIIKPYISRGDITVITATTNAEYKHIEKDSAISRRFQKVLISEPSNDVTREIVKGVLPHKSEIYKINVSDPDKIIDYIIENGIKYFPNRANPDRSLFLLDGAFAYAAQKRLNDVDIEALESYLNLMYNITISKTKASDTRKALKESLLGQDKAIDRIYEDLKICELGLVDPRSPLYSFIFAGPTGVGKTESCKIISKYFFGSENNIVTINMSEYKQEHSVSNMLGAPRGYKGYDNETTLISKVKQNPNCIVVFDEIEKAHPEIFDIFLRIIDEGELEDNRGNRVSFKNAIIVFTTNLGFDHDSNKPTGAGLYKEVTGTTNVKDALKDTFRPEFLGRVNDIVTFNYLTNDIVKSLSTRIAKEYLKRANIEYEPEFTEDEMKEICKMANVKEDGARHLTQAVRRVLARKLMTKEKVLA